MKLSDIIRDKIPDNSTVEAHIITDEKGGYTMQVWADAITLFQIHLDEVDFKLR